MEKSEAVFNALKKAAEPCTTKEIAYLAKVSYSTARDNLRLLVFRNQATMKMVKNTAYFEWVKK